MELKLAEQGALQHSAWHFELYAEQSHCAAAVAAAAKARSSGSGGGSCV